MSFDIFVQFYDKGEPAGVPVSALRAAFGSHALVADATHWQLSYDAWNCSDLYLAPSPLNGAAVGFTVNRPCGDLRLWNSLANILRLGNGVLFFPDGAHPMVGSMDAVSHLPRDMIEALGAAIVADTGQSILAQVKAT